MLYTSSVPMGSGKVERGFLVYLFEISLQSGLLVNKPLSTEETDLIILSPCGIFGTQLLWPEACQPEHRFTKPSHAGTVL